MMNKNKSMNNNIQTFIADKPVKHKTFCRICLSYCGLEVVSDGQKIDRIGPDKDHPYSWRDFCSKAGNSENLRVHPKRITKPIKKVGDRYIEASYEEAIADIAARLNKIRNEHGPHAIATYMGNPGASDTKTSMFQGAFMAGLGSANSFFVGSIDQNSFHVVSNEMYGCEMAVLNPDIDHADCILLIGTNPAVSTMSWCDASPNGWKRILARQKSDNLDLIVVDPRQTPSSKKADTHVTIEPGEDWAFLLGLIKVIFAQGWENKHDCVDANGVDTIREIAKQASLADLSQRCRVSVEQIEDIARRFAKAKTGFCSARTGVAHNRNGTIGEWLSHVLNIITGRVDRQGGRFYQPGVFKNTMKIINKMAPPKKRQSRIGGYEAIAGAYPLGILPDEITTPGRDQIRALIINGGNPVISGPDGKKLDAALHELDLLVAIDFFQRESHRHADWIIPACHFLEREDLYAIYGVIMEQSFAQLGRPVVNKPEGVRDEWEFFIDLSLAMGIPFFGVRGINTITKISRKIAKLTGNPRHAFNPRWIWAALIKMYGIVKWKDIVNNPQGIIYKQKEYGLFRQLLQTADGKIHAAPDRFVQVLMDRLSKPVTIDTNYPYSLVNQRRLSMINSWMVETNYHKRAYGDYVEINPEDAASKKIVDGQKVRVSSSVASVEVTASVTEDVPAGIVSMDHGWGSRLFDPKGGESPEVHGVCRNLLVSGNQLDEISGTPNLNGTRVNIEAISLPISA